MHILSLPITDEESVKVFTAPPDQRIQQQKEFVQRLGIPLSNSTPFMDYINHLQRINGMEVKNDIQPELNRAIEIDRQAHNFLMVIG